MLEKLQNAAALFHGMYSSAPVSEVLSASWQILLLLFLAHWAAVVCYGLGGWGITDILIELMALMEGWRVRALSRLRHSLALAGPVWQTNQQVKPVDVQFFTGSRMHHRVCWLSPLTTCCIHVSDNHDLDHVGFLEHSHLLKRPQKSTSVTNGKKRRH